MIQLKRFSALTAFLLLLTSGLLFGQSVSQSLGAGSLSSGIAGQVLSQLQGAGANAFNGASSSVTLPQLNPPQQKSSSSPSSSSSQTPTVQSEGSSAQASQTQQPSSIERMYSSRLPEGSTPLEQFGYKFLQRQPGSPYTSVSESYVVGPGDALTVYLWGDSVEVSGLSPRYDIQVDPNGSAFFPPVGSFPASGLSLKDITSYLKTALSKQYKKFDLTVTLAKMRQFPVYVSGFVNQPGPVLATATASVFDVIAAAGGIMKTGSLRNIVLHRANGTTRTLDLYNLLVSGKSTDIQVREGDSIFVPQIGPVAAIAGAVKRPGIYELKAEHTVGALISLAGGLLPSANLSSVSLLRFNGDQRRLIDAGSGQRKVSGLSLEDGDLVRVNAVRDYVTDEVKIDGEAMYPGSYSLSRTPTLKDLLEQAKVLPDTDLYYGRIYRTGSGGVSENLTFSPREILSGKGSIQLQPRDRVVLYPFGANLAAVDFNAFPNTVTLEGQIRYPGMYAWKPGMKLSDIFGMKNFLVDTNVQYGVVVRDEIGSNRQSIESFSPLAVAEGKTDITLKPLDQVQFIAKSITNPIQVSGAVKQSQVVQYYSGITLIDLLRSVKLEGNPSDMKAYVYPAPKEQQTKVQQATSQAGAGQQASSSPDQGSSQQQPGSTIITPGTPQQPASQSQSGQSSYNPETSTLGPGVQPPIGSTSVQSAGAVAAAIGTAQAAASTGPQQQTSQPAEPTQPTSGNGSSAGSTSSSGSSSSQSTSSQPTSQNPQNTPAAQTATVPNGPFVVYLDDLLRHRVTEQIPLQPGDQVVFAKVGPNEKAPQVIIRGQVANPGAYVLKPGMKLSDVIKEAGGYTNGAYPEGLVLLRKSTADFQRQQLDRAATELEYALQQNTQSSASAAASGQTSSSAVQLQIQAQQAQLSALRAQINGVLGRISIKMPKTLDALSQSNEDIQLENGDNIFVPRTPNFVQIIGNVFNPVTVAYRPGLKVKDYLALAGGPTQNSSMRDSYTILADGTIVSAREKPWSLFVPRTIANDPVTPGETIVIAQKPIKTGNVLPIIQQVASTVGSIASTALNVMAILKL